MITFVCLCNVLTGMGHRESWNLKTSEVTDQPFWTLERKSSGLREEGHELDGKKWS